MAAFHLLHNWPLPIAFLERQRKMGCTQSRSVDIDDPAMLKNYEDIEYRRRTTPGGITLDSKEKKIYDAMSKQRAGERKLYDGVEQNAGLSGMSVSPSFHL